MADTPTPTPSIDLSEVLGKYRTLKSQQAQLDEKMKPLREQLEVYVRSNGTVTDEFGYVKMMKRNETLAVKDMKSLESLLNSWTVADSSMKLADCARTILVFFETKPETNYLQVK